MKEATLCLLVRGEPAEEILLGFKKVGFGAGKITGFGGKVEQGESVVQAAARELQEETGIRVSEQALKPVGHLTFVFPARPLWSQAVHAFVVDTWYGEPTESAEMVPCWFRVDSVPFDDMWQDGRYWLPPILVGKRVRAHFTFQDDNETIHDMDIQTWDESGLPG